MRYMKIIQVTLGSLPNLVIYFISHLKHLSLIFGNKQASFFPSFVIESSMALSLENSLREHDVVEVVSPS